MKLTRKEVRTGQGMNITAMIDVVFLLIIFFMVISQFQKIELETLNLPRAKPISEDAPPQPSRLVINVHADGRILIERTEYTLDMLRALLQKETQNAKGRPPAVLIRGDRTTSWDVIRRLLNICVEYGVNQTDVGIEAKGGGK